MTKASPESSSRSSVPPIPAHAPHPNRSRFLYTSIMPNAPVAAWSLADSNAPLRSVELHVPQEGGAARRVSPSRGQASASSAPTSPPQGRPEATVASLDRETVAVSAPASLTSGSSSRSSPLNTRGESLPSAEGRGQKR